MLSRITVEIDYCNNGRPYFRIIENATSDDLRDKAITEFRRTFHLQSQWCVVDFGQVQMDGTIQWNIHPVPPEELDEAAYKMLEVSDGMSIVRDNSDGFRAWLDSEGIKWKASDTCTLIDRYCDLFLLGQSFAKYKAELLKS